MARKIVNILITVVLILLIALVVFIFITRMTGSTPSLFGYSVFRVQTDSMVPTLEVGDVILVKDSAPEDIHLGDIVTYRVTSGVLKGQTITHRVAVEPEVRGGTYYFRTKGDRQGATLDDEIPYSQILGKYVHTMPLVDKLYSFFLSPIGLISFIVLIVVLFGYEMISLIMSYRSVNEKGDDYYEPKNKKPSKKRKKPKKT